MVLGTKGKSGKGASVQVNYLIHLSEIKPWPPSQSLRSLRSVIIQWENGERNAGSTNAVVPSLGSGSVDGKIEFNESFKLPVTLLRDMSVKAGDADVFRKNCLEFNLYETRRDKNLKGQLLGTAMVDLAEHKVIRDTLSVTVPVNCQRNFRNTTQPLLFLKIQPVNRSRPRTSPGGGLPKEASLDKNSRESVSSLMKEEYAEEADANSFTDDDVSSHSSTTVSCTPSDSNHGIPPKIEKDEPHFVANDVGDSDKKGTLAPEPGSEHEESDVVPMGRSSRSSSVDLSSDLGSPDNNHSYASNSPRCTSMRIQKEVSHYSYSSSTSTASEQPEEDPSLVKASANIFSHAETHENTAPGATETENGAPQNVESEKDNFSSASSSNEEKVEALNYQNGQINKEVGEFVKIGELHAIENNMDCKYQKNGSAEHRSEEEHNVEDEPVNKALVGGLVQQGNQATDLFSSFKGSFETKANVLVTDRLKHVKSVRSTSDSARTNGVISNWSAEELNDGVLVQDALDIARSFRSNERKDAKFYAKDARSTLLEAKIQQLECRVQILEGELREAAGVEVALYSVAAEHGSSMSKVHAPARRLSRLYLHACREHSLSRRGSAAKSAVSGLVLVSKACGNDVPRLTYWLSNSVVLRTIISQKRGNLEPLVFPRAQNENSGSLKDNVKTSSLKWNHSPSNRNRNAGTKGLFDWEDPNSFIAALEKIEAWIFSRIVESIWWQTLTPYMHASTAKEIDQGMGSGKTKNNRKLEHADEREQEKISFELWKKAFADACERLCPIRAGGHECACVPLLSRLIMEQCVARLDVAMFNAILRESEDEIPTDPVSDPISDFSVLPIPVGKSSFGAGAQLKNVIGNWSRWLTDLFGTDDDSHKDESDSVDYDDRQDPTLKSFHLLNALSDLMMLPKDMLLDRSIRKEVCPTFGTALIKRILDSFAPDEFCPDPIPDAVFEALNIEDPSEDGDEIITSYPYMAAPPVYSPPSVASVEELIGESGSKSQLRRSGPSVLRKSYTSDDELDELNSPLASIFGGVSHSSPASRKLSWISKGSENQSNLRYELLRDIWMNSE